MDVFDPDDEADSPPPGTREPDDVPTIACSRCGRDWKLEYELDELAVGNQALEQFALDHKQHTGHFPDDVKTWQAICRQCPGEAERLSERGVVRWGETHARHTRHSVEIRHATDDETTVIDGDE